MFCHIFINAGILCIKLQEKLTSKTDLNPAWMLTTIVCRKTQTDPFSCCILKEGLVFLQWLSDCQELMWKHVEVSIKQAWITKFDQINAILHFHRINSKPGVDCNRQIATALNVKYIASWLLYSIQVKMSRTYIHVGTSCATYSLTWFIVF